MHLLFNLNTMTPLSIKRISIALLICISALSCTQQTEPAFKPDAVKSNIAPGQSLMIGALLQDYLNIKDALVDTKSDRANQSAISMLEKLKDLRNNFNIVSDQNKLPMDIAVQMDSIHLQLIQITSHNVKSCEPQRVYFKYLSDNVYTLIKEYRVTNAQLYSYFCPMAMNGKGGAWWLSNSPNVKNPYFGSKMLTCGERVDTLK